MILRETVPAELAGRRLDDAAKELFGLSKTKLRQVIDWGGMAVNASMVRVASRQVQAGDQLIAGIMEPENYVELRLTPEQIIYDSPAYVAVNKASGINAQRTPYQLKGTLEHAVSLYLRDTGCAEPVRIIHRLDRGTSGVMVFPKTKQAAAHVSKLLHDGEVEKVYWALAGGNPPEDEWRVDAPIAKIASARYGVARPGKDAITDFRVLSRGEGIFLVEVRPLTGRTHQIRVHLEHAGFPIVGDRTYGGLQAERLMLHCRQMSFVGPRGEGIRPMAPVEGAFEKVAAAQMISLPAAAGGGYAE